MTKIFNPKNYKDTVAQTTEWTTILQGKNSNLRIKRLSQEGETKLRFKPSASSIAIYRNCVLAGLAALALMTFTQAGTWIMWILAVIAVLLGGWGVYLQSQPLDFDKTAGVFRRGKKQSIKFDEIHAVQLLSRIVEAKTPPKGEVKQISIYELNLVLNDGSRVNLVSHGGLKEILEDSNAISDFINKPIWDAIK
jgi:hypothetical protein